MNSEVIAALIALCGVGLSLAASFAVALYKTRTEFQRLHTEVLQNYSGKLIEARLEHYPKLYGLISGLAKLAEHKKVSAVDLRKTAAEVDTWDSNHAILLSGYSSGTCYRFRRYLRQALSKDDSKIDELMSDGDRLRKLKQEIARLEIAIKGDLGVYETERFVAIRRAKTFEELRAIMEEEQ